MALLDQADTIFAINACGFKVPRQDAYPPPARAHSRQRSDLLHGANFVPGDAIEIASERHPHLTGARAGQAAPDSASSGAGQQHATGDRPVRGQPGTLRHFVYADYQKTHSEHPVNTFVVERLPRTPIWINDLRVRLSNSGGQNAIFFVAVRQFR